MNDIKQTNSADTGLLRASQQSKFVFDHIPKTGGSAFKTALEQIFGAGSVAPAVAGRSELWTEQKFPEYRVITGHFHSPIPGYGIARNRARITVLRDPVDRAVSEYFFYRNDVERVEWNKLAIFAKDHDLYAYLKLLEANRIGATSNVYAKRFASQISRLVSSDRQTLSLAQRALEQYDFIGIQEHFADSVDMFCCKFGLPLVPELTRVNVTSSRKMLFELDSMTRQKLVEMNKLDIQLYDEALARFQEQKRAVFCRFAGRQELGATLDEVNAHGDAMRKEFSFAETFGNRSVEIIESRIVREETAASAIRPGERISICIGIAAHVDVSELTVGIEISDELGEIVYGTNTHVQGKGSSVKAGGRYLVSFSFEANLKHGHYYVGASLHTGSTHEECCFHWCDQLTSFDVADEISSGFVGYCRLVPEIQWSSYA